MKKIFTLLSAAAIAVCGYAQDAWYVVGAFNSWNIGAAVPMVQEGDNYVVEIAKMKSNFKITNAQEWGKGEWGAVAGAQVELGVPFQLTNSGGGDIAFAASDDIDNAKLVLNTADKTLTVTGTPVFQNPELWLVGSFTVPDWNAPGAGSISPKFTENNGVYTLTTDFAGEFEFKVCADGWAPQWGLYAADAAELNDTNATAILNKKAGADPNNVKANFTGSYTVTFTLATGELTFVNVAGIETIEAEVAEGEAVFFNLQGQRVANPENGLYIRLQNGKAAKVAL